MHAAVSNIDAVIVLSSNGDLSKRDALQSICMVDPASEGVPMHQVAHWEWSYCQHYLFQPIVKLLNSSYNNEVKVVLLSETASVPCPCSVISMKSLRTHAFDLCRS